MFWRRLACTALSASPVRGLLLASYERDNCAQSFPEYLPNAPQCLGNGSGH